MCEVSVCLASFLLCLFALQPYLDGVGEGRDGNDRLLFLLRAFACEDKEIVLGHSYAAAVQSLLLYSQPLMVGLILSRGG